MKEGDDHEVRRLPGRALALAFELADRVLLVRCCGTGDRDRSASPEAVLREYAAALAAGSGQLLRAPPVVLILLNEPAVLPRALRAAAALFVSEIRWAASAAGAAPPPSYPAAPVVVVCLAGEEGGRMATCRVNPGRVPAGRLRALDGGPVLHLRGAAPRGRRRHLRGLPFHHDDVGLRGDPHDVKLHRGATGAALADNTGFNPETAPVALARFVSILPVREATSCAKYGAGAAGAGGTPGAPPQRAFRRQGAHHDRMRSRKPPAPPPLAVAAADDDDVAR
eukprot:tig00000681_g3081.t1